MGLWDGVKSFFGPKTTTTTTGLDPNSQRYVDQMRQQSQGASQLAIGGPQGGGSWFTGPQSMTIGQQVQPFMDPYQQQVVGGVQQIYDRNRAQALNQTSQQATMGGAYGGSRAAVLAGARLGEQDVGQANTIAGLLSSGYQQSLGQALPYWEQQRQLQQQQQMEPLWRQQQAQGFQNLGMGPTGQVQSQTSSGGQFGDILKTGAGLAATYFGAKGFGSLGGGGGGAPSGGYMGGPGGMPPGTQVPWQAPQWQPTYRGPYG